MPIVAIGSFMSIKHDTKENCNPILQSQDVQCEVVLDKGDLYKNHRLNSMGKEVLISSAIKVLFYIFKIVMSVIGIIDVVTLFSKEQSQKFEISLGLFIVATILACICLIHSIIVVVYAIKSGVKPFPASDDKVYLRYRKASIYALMLTIFGVVFLAISTPAEWLLHLAEESLTSFRADIDAGIIARFIGDIVVDIAFILLSLLAYLHCKHISKSKSKE